MKKKEEEIKVSTSISNFLNLLKEIEQAYPYMEEKLQEQDKLTQDLLHQLELENLKYKGRAKVATKLSQVRQARRNYKDYIEELQPVITYVQSNKKVINELQKLLGDTRKQEKKHVNRQYFPRIMDFATYKQESEE